MTRGTTSMTNNWMAAGGSILLLGLGIFALKAQEADPVQLPVADPNCPFFSTLREKRLSVLSPGDLTAQVMSRLGTAADPIQSASNAIPSAPGGSRTDSSQNPSSTIDNY